MEERSDLPILALVLGCLAVIGFGPIAGIPAWIIGKGAVDDISQGKIAKSQLKLARTGLALGQVGTVIWILFYFAPRLFQWSLL